MGIKSDITWLDEIECWNVHAQDNYSFTNLDTQPFMTHLTKPNKHGHWTARIA